MPGPAVLAGGTALSGPALRDDLRACRGKGARQVVAHKGCFNSMQVVGQLSLDGAGQGVGPCVAGFLPRVPDRPRAGTVVLLWCDDACLLHWLGAWTAVARWSLPIGLAGSVCSHGL